MEANQSWRDTNNLLLTHLLKYDWLLVDYLADAGKTVQAKWEEVWECTQTIADALGMSPHAHLGLALDMLECLPTTPAGLSFSSGIPRLMTHSPEALAYQGEGLESSNYHLLKDSTTVAILNQNLQQLLTVPATVLQDADMSASPKNSAPLPEPQVQQPLQPGGYTLGQISSMKWTLNTG